MTAAMSIPTGEARAKAMKRDFEYIEDDKVYVAYTLDPDSGKEIGFEAESLDAALDEVEAYDNLMSRREAIGFSYDPDTGRYTLAIKATGELIQGSVLAPLYTQAQASLLELAKQALPEAEPVRDEAPTPVETAKPKRGRKPKAVEAVAAGVTQVLNAAEPQIRTQPENRQEAADEGRRLPRSEEQRVDLSQTEAFFGGRDYADPRDRGQTAQSPFTDNAVPERKQRAYRILAQAQNKRADAYRMMADAAELQSLADQIMAGDA